MTRAGTVYNLLLPPEFPSHLETSCRRNMSAMSPNRRGREISSEQINGNSSVFVLRKIAEPGGGERICE